MDATSWIVWAIFVAAATALFFVGFWFSLRTLRWFTCGIAIALTITVARFGLAHPEYARSNLVDSFLSGIDQVAIALLHPLWPGRVPAPGVAGRWIIAVALLLGYRQFEGWALRRQAPELDLSAIGRGRLADHSPNRLVGRGGQQWHNYDNYPTAGQRQAQLAAELRFRLPTMEVRTPAILPGGTRTNALASIAETSGVSGAGMVSAILRFAGMFWPRPRLVRVRSWVESAASNRITVLLEDVKTGLPIATKTVAGDSFNEAASMVAGYIARRIFAMDRTVPEWCYGTADGRDLGAMQLVRLERVYAHCPKDVVNSRAVQIDILRSETGPVRTAGIVRYELAQLLALQRQYPESLRLHAVNRELHPRFYRGRYRLAMSLEMIANPKPFLINDKATRHKLTEMLNILSRCGLVDGTLQSYAANLMDSLNRHATTLPPKHDVPRMAIPTELAHKLLETAAQELRDVRVQLGVWHVVWDALFRRNERAVWLPHWRYQHRRPFRDGVCVAELLITIRRKLLGPGGKDPSWLKQTRYRWHLRQAVRTTWSIAGDPAIIKAVLTHPHGQWWPVNESETRPVHPARARHRVRWPPRQRRTASWQAAYNTACLYAALADEARTGGAPEKVLKDLENRTIISLRRVVENPHSELERAWDWVESDPDFHAMRDNPQAFTAFGKFLNELMQQEYPVSFMAGKCAIPHTNSARNTAISRSSPIMLERVASVTDYPRHETLIVKLDIPKISSEDPPL